MAILAPQLLLKAPADVRNYSMSFANLLESGETIETISSVTQTVNWNGSGGSASDLTIGTPEIVGSTVQAEISGGTANVDYLITVTVTTTDDNTLIGPGILQVRPTTG